VIARAWRFTTSHGTFDVALAAPSARRFEGGRARQLLELLVRSALSAGEAPALRKALGELMLSLGALPHPRDWDRLPRSTIEREVLRALAGAHEIGALAIERVAPVPTPLLGEAPPSAYSPSSSSSATSERPAPVKTWIAFELVGDDGLPVAGERYRVTLPDGSVREGALDASGRARFDDIDLGQCKFSLTDRDGEAWEPLA
jgi:hypothetical protein